MTRGLRSLALAGVALSALMLAGCEKPAPGVTVWSGTDSTHHAALCWQFEENRALSDRECAQSVLTNASEGQGIPAVEVLPGNTVGVSVDKAVAAGGWSVQVAGQTLATGLTETYFRFTMPEVVGQDSAGYVLTVTALARPTGARGYWFFKLIPG